MSEEVAYTGEIDEDAHVFTVAEFKKAGFIDYDGFGYPAKDGKEAGYDHKIFPSETHKIPADATHIVWYNR